MSTFHEDYGNLTEFEKQLQVCQALQWPTPFQVFKAWKPNNYRGLLFAIRDFVKENKPVTVRQVYYYLVTQQLIESNVKNYHVIVRLLTKMRLSGFVSFDWIVDDTRHPEKTPSWNNIKEILLAAVNQYRSDWQVDQPLYVEVWLEKRSLRRIFYSTTNRHDVFLCVGGGYQSLDMIKSAAQRMIQRAKNGQTSVILYFGDMNASGKDIPRDIITRMKMLGVSVQLKEIALTEEQILTYNLPTNPLKKTDKRSRWFQSKYPNAKGSVELDALPPETLRMILKTSLREHLDLEKLQSHYLEDQQQKEAANGLLGDFEQ